MEGYTGSRRAAVSQPVVPVATAEPAYDGTSMLACPSCGAAVRPDQAWCTLCLTRFGAPEPEPEPDPEPTPQPALAAANAPTAVSANGASPTAPAAPGTEAVAPTPEQAAQAALEQQADELLARLAADPAMNRPALPWFIATKGRRIMTTTVAAIAFSGVCWFGLVVLGAIFH